MNNLKERLIDIILEKSFQYREDPPFVLASGRKSNYYFNCKPTTLDPEGMHIIGELLFEMLKNVPISAAGGLTLGADPLAHALALISYQKERPIKAFIVRKETKDHGTKTAIEGGVTPGERVVILDDVITTGISTITAIERSKDAGLIVDRVIALIDREEGGRENILAHCPRVEAILTRSEIMDRYQERQ